ncbi:MAG: MFS transporter [Planctomycetes bacterium]|nr:MFS transporter [Planctomycetota bacterium]
MAVSRAEIVERNVRERLRALAAAPAAAPLAPVAPVREGFALDASTAASLLKSMAMSRALDLEARALKHRDAAYYTIGSAGHEGNAVLGEILRIDDPCFLHYRSGGLMMARSRKDPAVDPIYDTMLSFVAAVEDPIAGGRHKVWGSRRLWVPPQTSTIATQIPKATGMAFAIERAKRLKQPLPVSGDAIVCASFGDASLNHNVALSGFNTAAWAVYQKLPIPILFVCEDNGIGISVKTPAGWPFARMQSWPGIRYFYGDGLDLPDAWRAANEAIEYVRSQRQPAFLHLRTVRLLGHAGSDVETEYHTIPEIEAVESEDPLLKAVELVVGSGAMTAAEAEGCFDGIRDEVRAAAENCSKKVKLTTLEAVVAPLAPRHPDRVAAEASRAASAGERETIFGGKKQLPENHPKPRPMATLINWGLHDLMLQYPEMYLFGEDVAKKGGVYHVTADLADRFGAARVFNTLLDETSILGLALGMGHAGLLPVPEIQYLAYVHNAEDEIRGEACSLQYFSNGQFTNPTVMRIAAFGYQKGFGGHFHNDNSIGVLRDIPGLVIAAPSRGDDAVRMMRTCMASAKIDGSVVAFLEPIALYYEKDLYENADGGWLCRYPATGESVPVGESRLYCEDNDRDRDLLIISYANGLRLSLIAAKKLREKNVHARVLDLRWLAPLDHEAVAREAAICKKILVVDECRKTGGGVAEAIITDLAERPESSQWRLARHTGADTYIPLGPAANLCLPGVESIERAALQLFDSHSTPAPRAARRRS